MRIVIADDYATFRRVLADMLRDDGHEVDEVGDGPTLLARIVADGPDLVISDLRLPISSAVAVLEDLRARGLVVRVVVMTGMSSDDELVSRLAGLGVLRILHKPFTFDELRNAIADVA